MKCATCESELATADPCLSCSEIGQAAALTKDGISVSQSETGFHCPDCDQEALRVGTLGETQVCFCGQCHGFVVDRASLGELIELLRAAYEGPDDLPQTLNEAETHRRTSCPACFETMETFPYFGPGNVVIDTCEACKLTWLDSGELNRIVRALGRRDYVMPTGESEVLRKRLYAQAEESGDMRLALLGRIFF